MLKNALEMLLFLCLASVLLSVAASAVKYPVVEPYINDYAGILDTPCENQLETIAKNIDDKTTAEIVTVTIPTIGDSDLSEYANGLFREAGIGERDKNNGLLILIVSDVRKYRFEVGYGLEGDITDADTLRLADDYLKPSASKDMFCEGLLSTYGEISGMLVGNETVVETIGIGGFEFTWEQLVWVVIIIIIIIVVLFLIGAESLLFLGFSLGARSLGGGSSGGGGSEGDL